MQQGVASGVRGNPPIAFALEMKEILEYMKRKAYSKGKGYSDCVRIWDCISARVTWTS